MTTYRQLAQGRVIRIRIVRKSRRSALQQCPQRRGVCMKPKIVKPKKPNSAQRKVVRVQLTSRRTVTCMIPGEGHTLQQYSSVLVRGGRVRDIPGLQYRIIRGVYDATPVATRARGRSKYGTKVWKRKQQVTGKKS